MLQKILKEIISKGNNFLNSVWDASEKAQYYYFFRKKKMLQKTLKDVIVKGKNFLKSVGDAREKTQYFYFFLEKNKKKKKKWRYEVMVNNKETLKAPPPASPTSPIFWVYFFTLTKQGVVQIQHSFFHWLEFVLKKHRTSANILHKKTHFI